MPQQPQSKPPTGWTPVDETQAAPNGWTPVVEDKPGMLSRADTAITSTLEPNPENYRGAFRTNAIEVPKTLGREVYSAGKTIAGIADPRPYYHALTDEAKEDEPVSFANPNDPSGGILSRAVYRMMGKPIQNAVEDYSGGKVSPEAALSVAPEAIGAGGGTVVAGKLAGMLAPKAAALAESVPAGKIARSMGAIAKPGAVLAEDLPVVGSVIKGVKATKNVAGDLGDIWAKKPVNAGGPLPEAPDPALLQARSLFEGSTSPPDPAAGLGTIKQPGQAGTIAASMQKPAAAEVAPGFQRGSLQTLLDRSLGAKQLDPKVPLRNQMDVATPAARPASSSATVPEGHIPVQSTALKSYKYDAGAGEFHAKYGGADNTVHVFGDVTPDEAQAFDGAPSKGQAMQQIKNNHPLVAKIINGKRVAVKASTTQ